MECFRAESGSVSEKSWFVCGSEISDRIEEVDKLIRSQNAEGILNSINTWVSFAQENLDWPVITKKLVMSHNKPLVCTPLRASTSRPPVIEISDDDKDEKEDKFDLGDDDDDEDIVLPFKKSRPTDFEKIMGTLRDHEKKLDELRTQFAKHDEVYENVLQALLRPHP